MPSGAIQAFRRAKPAGLQEPVFHPKSPYPHRRWLHVRLAATTELPGFFADPLEQRDQIGIEEIFLQQQFAGLSLGILFDDFHNKTGFDP